MLDFVRMLKCSSSFDIHCKPATQQLKLLGKVVSWHGIGSPCFRRSWVRTSSMSNLNYIYLPSIYSTFPSKVQSRCLPHGPKAQVMSVMYSVCLMYILSHDRIAYAFG